MSENQLGRLASGGCLLTKRMMNVATLPLSGGGLFLACWVASGDLGAPIGYGRSAKNAIAALARDTVNRWEMFVRTDEHITAADEKQARPWLMKQREWLMEHFEEAKAVGA